MVLTLTPAVHTTGVNWESVSIIFGGFATVALALGALLGWAIRRVERSRARTETFVTERVTEVTAMLTSALRDVNSHLEHQDRKLDDTRDKVMLLRGGRRRWMW